MTIPCNGLPRYRRPLTNWKPSSLNQAQDRRGLRLLGGNRLLKRLQRFAYALRAIYLRLKNQRQGLRVRSGRGWHKMRQLGTRLRCRWGRIRTLPHGRLRNPQSHRPKCLQSWWRRWCNTFCWTSESVVCYASAPFCGSLPCGTGALVETTGGTETLSQTSNPVTPQDVRRVLHRSWSSSQTLRTTLCCRVL